MGMIIVRKRKASPGVLKCLVNKDEKKPEMETEGEGCMVSSFPAYSNFEIYIMIEYLQEK
jgi:hypothetical protein